VALVNYCISSLVVFVQFPGFISQLNKSCCLVPKVLSDLAALALSESVFCVNASTIISNE
jgi:hypothetical protein